MRHVEPLRDLRLRNGLVKAQVQDDALAPAQDRKSAFQVRAVFEARERRIDLSDVVRERLRVLVTFARDLGIEREEVIRLS